MRSAVSPGAIRQISQCCLRLPPSLPNNPNTFIPRDFAAPAARTTFSEFPLVESTTSRSPGCPSANSGRAKISANPKSFAVQVMCPASLSAIAGSGFLSLRNLPVHSSAKWVASHKLPPFPQVKTLPSRSNTSRISSAVAAMVAIFSGFRINRSSTSCASNNASRIIYAKCPYFLILRRKNRRSNYFRNCRFTPKFGKFLPTSHQARALH